MMKLFINTIKIKQEIHNYIYNPNQTIIFIFYILYLKYKSNVMSVNYFLYKIMMLNIRNNNSFIRCNIDNNIVSCKNKMIKDDIISKILPNDKIKHISFFVFKQTYEINEGDENYSYYNTVKNLPFIWLPVYKKNDTLRQFMTNFSKFSELNTRSYETKKFERFGHTFNTIISCQEINGSMYQITNMINMSRHAFLPIRSFFNYELVENKATNKIYTSQHDVINTVLYLYNYLKYGIVVGIKSNKIVLFTPFNNKNYENDYVEELYFDSKDRENLINSKNNDDIKDKIDGTTKYYNSKINTDKEIIILDRYKWNGNDNYFYKYRKSNKIQLIYLDMLVNLCNTKTINDCLFILNLHHDPVLRKDRKHPYTNIVNKDIPSIYKHDFCPIFSLTSSPQHDDIPLITENECVRVSKKYYPTQCENKYLNNGTNNNINWESKINKLLFRGEIGFDSDNKTIIIASQIFEKNNDIFDFGLTTTKKIYNKELNKPITIIDMTNHKIVDDVSQPSKYKYILNIGSQDSIANLSDQMHTNSVVFLVNSKNKIWYFDIMKEYEHYIPIDADLSNLIKQIKWCTDNDSKCKQIAQNASQFYEKHLQINGMNNYMSSQLNKIILYREPTKIKTKIVIIACYRDNATHSRYIELNMYIFTMSKMLNHANVDFKIITVEQNSKNRFNIGKLKNIGFKFANEKGSYDNYIFTDIDMLPDHDLFEKYLKVTDGMNSLASRGTRYENMDPNFFGGAISCTKKVFEQINGYSNLYSRGWGGEDINLHLRCKLEKIINYIPDKGNIIDIEENSQGKNKSTTEKTVELKKENNYDMLRFEIALKYDLYKEDGLTNLEYSINYQNYNDNAWHIIVDPEQKLQETNNPTHFDISGYSSAKYKAYKRFVKKLDMVKLPF